MDKPIDLYDTPIDLRPVPKQDPVEECIEYLRSHGDYFGVNLLNQMRVERVTRQEDSENPERAREEKG